MLSVGRIDLGGKSAIDSAMSIFVAVSKLSYISNMPEKLRQSEGILVRFKWLMYSGAILFDARTHQFPLPLPYGIPTVTSYNAAIS